MAQEGILGSMYIVAIHATGGRETGMQVVSDTMHATNGNVLRHKTVELIGKLNAIDLAIDVKVSHHHTGMNASIGAASTCQGNITTEQQRQRSLQLLLHRVAVRLNLPAVIACTIVAESHEISHTRSVAAL